MAGTSPGYDDVDRSWILQAGIIGAQDPRLRSDFDLRGEVMLLLGLLVLGVGGENLLGDQPGILPDRGLDPGGDVRIGA
jgi:hypothetical protein